MKITEHILTPDKGVGPCYLCDAETSTYCMDCNVWVCDSSNCVYQHDNVALSGKVLKATIPEHLRIKLKKFVAGIFKDLGVDAETLVWDDVSGSGFYWSHGGSTRIYSFPPTEIYSVVGIEDREAIREVSEKLRSLIGHRGRTA